MATAPRRNADALGEILWLLSHSPLHQGRQLVDLDRFLFPALQTGRYKTHKREGRPIAYVSIALLSKSTEDLWLAGGYLLQAEGWASGDRPWIMDLVAPFGDAEEVQKKIAYEPELAFEPVRALRPSKNGEGLRIVTHGQYQVRHQTPLLKRLVNIPHPPRADAPVFSDPVLSPRQSWRRMMTQGGHHPRPTKELCPMRATLCGATPINGGGNAGMNIRLDPAESDRGCGDAMRAPTDDTPMKTTHP